MSDADTSNLVPEDELRAAFAEIQKMAGGQLSAIPSLLDDNDDNTQPVDIQSDSSELNADVEPNESEDVGDEPGGEPESELATVFEKLDELSAEVQERLGEKSESTEPEATPESEEPDVPTEREEPVAEVPPVVDEPSPPASPPARKDNPFDDAVAELESMSEEEAEAIPSLDFGEDGRDVAGDETPSTEESEACESASAEEGGDSVSDPDLGGADLAAALAEVEEVSTHSNGEPSDADAVEAQVEGDAESAEASGDPTPDEAPDQNSKPAAAKPPRKKPRFKVGAKAAEKDVAEYIPPDEPVAAEPAAVVVAPVAPLRKRIYRAVDQALDTLNQPFGWLSDRAKMLMGWVALSTLLTSFLAILLMPVILPNRDAISFLNDRLELLNAPPPEVGAAEDGDEAKEEQP